MREAAPAMKPLPTLAAAALTLLLAACHHKPEVIDTTAPDPMASQLANAAPVTLPPVMTASVAFRCQDNTLVNVDFFKGNTQANLKPTKDASTIVLKADKDGDPLTGGGYTMTGNQDKITLTGSGKSAQTCTH
jgi:uncharacterized lipoprotein YajG